MKIPIGQIKRVVQEIWVEFDRSMIAQPLFHSAHEGISIIREEFEELWDCVKTNQPAYATRHEAIQTAATALKFLVSMSHWEE